jgi:hypothetical protein
MGSSPVWAALMENPQSPVAFGVGLLGDFEGATPAVGIVD